MAFLLNPRDELEDNYLYEHSGDEDDRLRKFWERNRPPSTVSQDSETQTLSSFAAGEDLRLQEILEPLEDELQKLQLEIVELKAKYTVSKNDVKYYKARLNELLANKECKCQSDLMKENNKNDPEQEQYLQSVKEIQKSIVITVVSNHFDKKKKALRQDICSGRYDLAEMVNDRPAYKQEEEDENGHDMYLWYHGTQKHWRFSRGLDFEARNDWCIMYIESQEYDVKKLGRTWFESIDRKARETAKVTIT